MIQRISPYPDRNLQAENCIPPALEAVFFQKLKQFHKHNLRVPVCKCWMEKKAAEQKREHNIAMDTGIK
jgi:hypothetical protein